MTLIVMTLVACAFITEPIIFVLILVVLLLIDYVMDDEGGLGDDRPQGV